MVSSVFPVFLYCTGYVHYRNIVTHHAEDGSGVGSTIIAGRALHFLIEILLCSCGHSRAMTKARWDAGLYPII